jgi:hypothetical protein
VAATLGERPITRHVRQGPAVSARRSTYLLAAKIDCDCDNDNDNETKETPAMRPD